MTENQSKAVAGLDTPCWEGSGSYDKAALQQTWAAIDEPPFTHQANTQQKWVLLILHCERHKHDLELKNEMQVLFTAASLFQGH